MNVTACYNVSTVYTIMVALWQNSLVTASCNWINAGECVEYLKNEKNVAYLSSSLYNFFNLNYVIVTLSSDAVPFSSATICSTLFTYLLEA